MTERILGPTGSTRRRRFLWVPMLLIACTALFVIASAQGVPGGQNVFELDASLDLSNGSAPKAAVTDNATAGLPDDWDRIANGGDHALAKSFDAETTADGSANNATIFTGGGS